LAVQTLISIDALAERIADPRVVPIDCRFTLEDPAWGARVFADAHIPGAQYAHLNDDLSGARTGANGRHPLPDIAALASRVESWGVGDEIQVVAYDQHTGMFASRLWWLLRWLGHDAVAVLDGGFERWQAARLPVEHGAARVRPRGAFHPVPRPDMVVTAREVSARLGDPGWRLIDARAPERFRGESEPLDRVAGHIPTARNRFFQENVSASRRFRGREELRDAFARVLGGAAPAHTINYCGSGVTACHNVLAMEHAGLSGARLYVGSWSEWSSDPGRPIETGSSKPEA